MNCSGIFNLIFDQIIKKCKQMNHLNSYQQTALITSARKAYIYISVHLLKRRYAVL